MADQIRFENHVGEMLSGTLHLSDTPATLGVVLCHCFTCSRHTTILRRIADDLTNQGIAALRFDFSGNGQSEGRFSESTYTKMSAEVGAAVRRLRKEGPAIIGLSGHSMGATVSVIHAAKSDEIAAVCTLGGRLSGTRMENVLTAGQIKQIQENGRVTIISRGRELEMASDFFRDAEENDVKKAIGELKIPLLVVHGDRDEVVPVFEAHTAEKMNPERVRTAIINGADHMFSDKELQQDISKTVTGFFLEMGNSGT